MTAIAALRYNNGIVMGGDSAGVDGHYGLTVRHDPKVFRVGPFIIGYTSSFRMAQLLRYGLHGCLLIADLNPPQKYADAFAFMVRDFVPRARWLFRQGGYLKDICGREDAGTFLVAWSNHVFMVSDSLQVVDAENPYIACGSAADVCEGALHALSMQDAVQTYETAMRNMQSVLSAAERHSAAVRGPFVMLSTEEQI